MADSKARARVTVTLEVELAAVWAADCPINQIHKQARDEIEGVLRAGVAINGLKNSYGGTSPARIIGVPVVTAVLVDG